MTCKQVLLMQYSKVNTQSYAMSRQTDSSTDCFCGQLSTLLMHQDSWPSYDVRRAHNSSAYQQFILRESMHKKNKNMSAVKIKRSMQIQTLLKYTELAVYEQMSFKYKHSLLSKHSDRIQRLCHHFLMSVSNNLN